MTRKELSNHNDEVILGNADQIRGQTRAALLHTLSMSRTDSAKAPVQYQTTTSQTLSKERRSGNGRLRPLLANIDRYRTAAENRMKKQQQPCKKEGTEKTDMTQTILAASRLASRKNTFDEVATIGEMLMTVVKSQSVFHHRRL